MLDASVLNTTRTFIEALAKRIDAAGIKADTLTWFGFVIGLISVPLIVYGYFEGAIFTLLLNRLFDGLDGAVARVQGATDRGAFLDIALDFIFYASIPLAFAIHQPDVNALAAACVLFAFIGTGTSFLAYAIFAQKREMKSTAFPRKGFFYLGGLTEASETIIFFVLSCLLPSYFSVFAYLFAALCLITTALRISAGRQSFK